MMMVVVSSFSVRPNATNPLCQVCTKVSMYGTAARVVYAKAGVASASKMVGLSFCGKSYTAAEMVDAIEAQLTSPVAAEADAAVVRAIADGAIGDGGGGVSSCEIMVHPGIPAAGQGWDSFDEAIERWEELETLCSPALRELLQTRLGVVVPEHKVALPQGCGATAAAAVDGGCSGGVGAGAGAGAGGGSARSTGSTGVDTVTQWSAQPSPSAEGRRFLEQGQGQGQGQGTGDGAGPGGRKGERTEVAEVGRLVSMDERDILVDCGAGAASSGQSALPVVLRLQVREQENPLPTEILLEDTDGVLRPPFYNAPHRCPLGCGSRLRSLPADVRLSSNSW